MLIKSRISDTCFKINDEQNEFLQKLFVLIGLIKYCLTASTKSYTATQIGTMIEYHLENETLMESGSMLDVCVRPKGLVLPDSFKPLRHERSYWLSKLANFLIGSGGFDPVEERQPRKRFY